MKKNTKKSTMVILVVLIILLVIALVLLYSYKNIIKESNGRLNEQQIIYDKEEGIKFKNDEVIIIFDENVTEERRQEIIHEINGNVVSSISEMDFYEVKIDKTFQSISEINAYCDSLKEKFDEIVGAYSNDIIEVTPDVIDPKAKNY